mgnify:CR=1 FL=1
MVEIDRHVWRVGETENALELLLGGALADPADQALLLFAGETAEVAEKFARQDPYVINGVVRSWKVRQWTTVAGEWAATPVLPSH